MVTCLVWGSTWLAIKLGLEGVPPFLGAGLRFTLAAAVLWGMVRAAGLSWRPTPDGRKAVASASLLSFGASYALVYWSETRVPSGLVASFYALVPLATALMTAFVTRTERLTPAKAGGVLIGAAGVALLFWPDKGAAGADAVGLAAALASSLLSAVNLVCQSLWSKGDDARVLNAWGMTFGGAMLLALSLAFERGTAPSWTPANVAAIVYLALAGSVAAFLAFYALIKRLPATKVSLITLIFPVVALILGWIVLGEAIRPRAAAGVALILGGVGLALAAGRTARLSRA